MRKRGSEEVKMGRVPALAVKFKLAPPLVLAVAVVALLGGLPWLGLSQAGYWLYLLTEALAWGLFALSFDLLYGYSGLLSLGQSVFFGVGAYGAVLGSLKLGLGLFPSLLLGVGAALALAGLLGPALVRVPGHGFIILTLVLAVIFHLVALWLRPLTGGDDGLSLSAPQFLGWSLAEPLVNYYFVLGVALLAALSMLRLVKGPIGLAFRLVRENPQRAAALGYNVFEVRLLAFLISGGLAGLAGVLYLFTSRFASAELLHWTTAAGPLVWTLLGGAGTFIGPLLGTGLLIWVRELLSSWWGYGYPLLVGGLIVLVAIFAPRGLVGTIAERRRRWRWG